MYLSKIVAKPVFVLQNTKSGKRTKRIGICRGIGYAVKTRSVSHLLCSDDEEKEFLLPVSLLDGDDGLIFTKARRLAFSKSVKRFTLGKPVYRSSGEYLGIVADLKIDETFKATYFETDNGTPYPCDSLIGLSDALIVGKRPPFPIEQTLKADFLTPTASFEKGTSVTRSLLRSAIRTGNLIRLTTSLFPRTVSVKENISRPF